uniref:Uncharacterized protein n=1 Tax=Mycena chlorophos TaxID=658473 RepID=A0ABQ0L569_MYCCL|nr:predicted protein [Mycena chlorophos]
MSACQFTSSEDFCRCSSGCTAVQNTILYAEINNKLECDLYAMVPALVGQAFHAVLLPAGFSIQTHAQATVTHNLPVDGSDERYQLSRALDFGITVLYEGQGPEFIHWESKPFPFGNWAGRLRDQDTPLHEAWTALTACLPQILIQGYLWLLRDDGENGSQFLVVQIGPYFCLFEFKELAVKSRSVPVAATQVVPGTFDKLHWMDCIDAEHVECHYLLEPLYELSPDQASYNLDRRVSVQLCSAFRYALHNLSRHWHQDELQEVQYLLPRFNLHRPSSRPTNNENIRSLGVPLWAGAKATVTPSQIIRRYLKVEADKLQALRNELNKPPVGSAKPHDTEDRLQYYFGSPTKSFSLKPRIKRSASRGGEASTSKRPNLK